MIRLVAYGLVAGKSQQEQVRILQEAGMSAVETALVIGTKPNLVNAVRSNLRKKGQVRGVSRNGRA